MKKEIFFKFEKIRFKKSGFWKVYRQKMCKIIFTDRCFRQEKKRHIFVYTFISYYFCKNNSDRNV